MNPPVDPPVTAPVADTPTTTPTTVPVDSTPTGAPVSTGIPTETPTAQQVTTPVVLSEENTILVAVLVGVGVPVLAGAITLILLRKRLTKKKSDEGDSVYSAINLPSKDDPLFEKKMLIPFKQLSFTKEIGAGSFGKVFLGYVLLLVTQSRLTATQ